MFLAGLLVSEEFLVIWCCLDVFQNCFSINADKQISSSRESEGTCEIAEMVRCVKDLEGNLVLNAGKLVIDVFYIILKLERVPVMKSQAQLLETYPIDSYL